MKYVEIIEDAFTPLMDNVNCGQFFKYEGDLHVRISKNTSGAWRAYNFATKKTPWIPHTNRVQMVDCTITYKYVGQQTD